jgi:folate-binding protein YgfZ
MDMDSRKSASPEIEAELEVLATGAGLHRRPQRMVVRMSGDDRVSFLHGMCSNDVKNLKPGTLTYALVLTDRAHIVADLYIWADNDALYLELDRGLWAKTREHLEKFLVADDVEMEEREDLAVVDIIGPNSPAAIANVSASSAALQPWHFVRDDGRLIANLPRIGLTSFTVILPSAQMDSFLAGLRNNPEIREVSDAAVEVLRVERGIARVGVDATEQTIALEARLEGGISYSKGCYVGQETVERATARGGVKKRLYGVRIGGRLPQAGAAAWLDGKEVGHLTSVAASPRLGYLGLGVLHHSAWKPGTALTVRDAEGETAGVVSDLPFVD